MTSDQSVLIQALNSALASELQSLMRYKQNYFSALEMNLGSDAEGFLQLAESREEHVDLLAERILQLGGLPEFHPPELSNSFETLVEKNLEEEERKILKAKEILHFLENRDPETQQILEEILKQTQQETHHLAKKLKKAA